MLSENSEKADYRGKRASKEKVVLRFLPQLRPPADFVRAGRVRSSTMQAFAPKPKGPS